MKNCWSKCLVTLFGFIILGIFAYAWHQSAQTKKQILAYKINSAIVFHNENKTPYIDFYEITDFSWDRLYVFGPYTSQKATSESLEFFWPGYYCTSVESNEAITLLVFVKGNRVVQYLEVGREYDFSYAYKEEGYAINDSRFVLGERNRMTWLPNK